MPPRKSYRLNLRKIKLLLLDVDGVLTDGGIFLSNSGEEFKRFHTQDGHGLVKLQKAGVRVGILTGRTSKLVQRRAEELGIEELHQGVEGKLSVYDSIKKKYRLEDDEIAYIGDDEPDLEIIRFTGFSAAPADAAPQVRTAVDYVCRKRGGEGAVREVVELILETQSHAGE